MEAAYAEFEQNLKKRLSYGSGFTLSHWSHNFSWMYDLLPSQTSKN